MSEASSTCVCTRIRGCLLCKKKDLYEPPHIDSTDCSHVPGLYLLPEFLTLEEETLLASYFDGLKCQSSSDESCRFRNIIPERVISSEKAPLWVVSQSGRRKQDYGPKINFQKRKIKLGDECRPVPAFLRKFLENLANASCAPCDADETFASKVRQAMTGFDAIEMVALDYQPQRGSHIEPHFDDFWAWGSRIIGVNLLSDADMIFVRPPDGEANVKEFNVKVRIPRRSVYIMSGDSRYVWQHAISASMIPSRRVSLTFRELAKGVMEEEPDVCRQLIELNRY